ncbi:RNA-directed DNA polymerase [Actinomycetaceae bacterium WB03_NA08]|uniref:RNA-directed DNA polymerase n=1 Tax=Scrofimicrobium canadense TaxID=2652290 RepID=A0A6N7W9J4_9ACTO|nr:antiviral reverse transcriptase Drt3a [Scrofimicrobium canadense]MSS84818.1 RNA-directed DNA polymerase [Scrofimicrobium canadense]
MTVLPYTLKSYVVLTELLGRRAKDPTLRDPDVANAVTALKNRRDRYKDDLVGCNGDDKKQQKVKEAFRADRLKLREARDEATTRALNAALDQLNTELEGTKFSWVLAQGETVAGKLTYQIGASLHLQIASKQVESVVRSAILTPVTERNGVIRALQQALDRKYKHGVIRLDLKSYFESIPHDGIRAALVASSRIDTVTRELVDQLIQEFAVLTGNDHGVPRGVGISSALADLYLSDFDRKLRTMPGVAFYARYVDDIIVVTQAADQMAGISSMISDLLVRLGLEKNASKSFDLTTNDKGQYTQGRAEIEYLGYTFSRPGGHTSLETRLTPKRTDRYVRKIECAFDSWLRSKPSAERANTGSDGLLIKRIRFLSTNTRLHNSKSGVSVGIYFSNSALPESAPQLQELDCRLTQLIEQHKGKMSERLETRLRQQSFVSGFKQRAFLRYSPKDLQQISRCWEHIV